MNTDKIQTFAKKISRNLTSSDYKGLYSKTGVINLLKGYGLPLNDNDINDDNWENIYDTLICL